MSKIGFEVHGDKHFHMPPFAFFTPYLLVTGADELQSPEHLVRGFENFLQAGGYFKLQEQFSLLLLDLVVYSLLRSTHWSRRIGSTMRQDMGVHWQAALTSTPDWMMDTGRSDETTTTMISVCSAVNRRAEL